jgi:plastocyanin
MLRRLLRASLLVLTLAALAGCGEAANDPPRASPAGGPTVTLLATSFSPPATKVAVGDTVTWVWDGRVQHDVVFDDGPSSRRQRNGTWQRAFDRPGTYNYVCTLHRNMTGRVVVE